MKIAIVYDRVNKWGGAERVLLSLHELFPDALLYTSVYNPKTAPWAKVFPKVIPSFLQKFPYAAIRHDLYAFLMPFAFESFNFSQYDLVISVTSESAKGIITGPKTYHICYCLTPTRYLWSGYGQYFKSNFLKILSKPVIFFLKKWDVIAAQRPDQIIAISSTVQKRIKEYYKRESMIIFPPVNTQKFKTKSPLFKITMKGVIPGEYFLVVSRLVPYKKVDLVIYAFNKLKLPLVVVGEGSEENRLKKIAGSNIMFTGLLNDEELARFYTYCKAFIMPQDEDFGIACLEAQSVGKPVIAFKKGGALDTVIDGKTGIFFEEQNEESLIRAIDKFNKTKFDQKEIENHANSFSESKFKNQILELVKKIK